VNALVLDPEPHPPDVERGEAMDAARGERHPVVGPDGPGQPERAEGALEDGPRTARLDVGQGATGEQIARVLVANRERIAPDPVPGGELPFEIGGPQVVGGRGDRRHHTRMLMGAAAPALLDHALADEEIPHRAHRGPRFLRDLRMPRPEPVQELARPPVRMLAARLDQEVGHFRVDAVGTMMRGVAAILQAPPALLVIAGQPLVAGLATDAVAGSQLRSGVQTAPIVGDEAFALLHG
jgi:hypothetical protein